MVVISEPGKVLVGGGKNAKYVKECKELYLGGKGIEKLRGFEPFVNLEALWINGNKLKKVNNLDENFRIKALYAQDNQICTLKGSLPNLKFLEVLDLSNNALRDLDKLLLVLSKFQFLKNLNLAGNPCCEEPDYRLTVIHTLKQLEVLDQHTVTGAERRKAEGQIGGSVQALTVAFMERAPPRDPAWDAKVPERSRLEQELGKEAAAVRDKRVNKAYEAETALFKHNPYPDIPRGNSLPPNAGMRQAMETHERLQRESEDAAIAAAASTSFSAFGTLSRGRSPSTVPPLPNGFASGSAALDPFASLSLKSRPTTGTLSRAGTAKSGHSRASKAYGGRPAPPTRAQLAAAEAARLEANSPYKPKDLLTVRHCSHRDNDLTESGTHTAFLPVGPIKFEAEKYESWAMKKAAGGGGWQMNERQLHV